MLTVVKKHLSLLKCYFMFNLSASMEYRTSFLIQVFGMFLNNASFAFFWWLLFDKVGSIGGYGFSDVMYLWAFTSTSFGITFVLFGNLNNLVDIITKGELDTYLLQPKDVVINTIASKTNISGWGDIMYGIILFIILKGFDIKGSVLFFLFVITGTMLYTSVLLTANSLAFFFGNVSHLAQLVFEFIITMTIYPESIFDGWVKWVILTIIPAGFITMVPLRILKSFNVFWMGLTIFVAIVWMIVAYTLFYKGLKRYESGNLIVQKM